ncbi:MAG: Uma2 family endonuclease [Thioalkalivibrio sp.]|nr:MAG: Uma2 family endonuclease [Thioalkalivibrio sp.]
MVGARDRHTGILSALAFALTPAARKRRCQLFTSDMKVRLEIGKQNVFYYPDLPVPCDSEDDARPARVMNASTYPTK